MGDTPFEIMVKGDPNHGNASASIGYGAFGRTAPDHGTDHLTDRIRELATESLSVRDDAAVQALARQLAETRPARVEDEIALIRLTSVSTIRDLLSGLPPERARTNLGDVRGAEGDAPSGHPHDTGFDGSCPDVVDPRRSAADTLFDLIAEHDRAVPKSVWGPALGTHGFKPGTGDAARSKLVRDGLIAGANGTYGLTSKGRARRVEELDEVRRQNRRIS